MKDTGITDHYSKDHGRLDELFRQFQALRPFDRAQAVQLFQEFKSGLEQPNQREEAILYPLIDRYTDAGERAGFFIRMGVAA